MWGTLSKDLDGYTDHQEQCQNENPFRELQQTLSEVTKEITIMSNILRSAP